MTKSGKLFNKFYHPVTVKSYFHKSHLNLFSEVVNYCHLRWWFNHGWRNNCIIFSRDYFVCFYRTASDASVMQHWRLSFVD